MSGIAEVGARLTWDQVYATLEPTGVNVVGGVCPTLALQGQRLVEVSVFHYSRVGSQIVSGYSYKTSSHGLAVDNVAGYELVLPNGTIINVSSSDDDLWFGLGVRESSIQISMR
jgi:FAD/FMN-containing dehydrogenase